ncbi:MAG: oligosaccharide flippase family protein, partial [Pseudomonadota bacterium]
LLIAAVPTMRAQAGVYLACFLTVIGSIVFPTWLFQGLEVMRVTTLYSVSGRLLVTLGIFALVRSPEDVVIATLLQSGGTLVSGILVAGEVRRLSGATWRDVLGTGAKRVRAWHRRTFDLSISEFLVQAASNSSVFIVSLLTGNAVTGAYAALEKLARASASAVQPIVRVVFPRVAALWKSSAIDARRFAQRITLGLLGL